MGSIPGQLDVDFTIIQHSQWPLTQTGTLTQRWREKELARRERAAPPDAEAAADKVLPLRVPARSYDHERADRSATPSNLPPASRPAPSDRTRAPQGVLDETQGLPPETSPARQHPPPLPRQK
jgi:hypothetical protein